MRISVILSTYNHPTALQRTLWGYAVQTDTDFEIIVADDGSQCETRHIVQKFSAQSPLTLRHVWHEDLGFRKTVILNKALQQAAGAYLVFSDGDCIPRNDFVAAHRRLARRGFFISGGSHIDIPESIHQDLTATDISQQRVFDIAWLRERAGHMRRFRYRLTRNGQLAWLLDRLTPRPGVFVGCNAAAWKHDVLAVNGFDETIGYGFEDQELGVRLTNLGIRSCRRKYSLVTVHQTHARPYRDAEIVHSNRQRLRQTRTRRIIRTSHGIGASAEH